MNKEKGSNNLVLVPIRTLDSDRKEAVTSLMTLDYIPIYSKSSFVKDTYDKIQAKKDTGSRLLDVQEIVLDLHAYS